MTTLEANQTCSITVKELRDKIDELKLEVKKRNQKIKDLKSITSRSLKKEK